MRGFSFFRRTGGSGKIRAIQIAQYLNEKYGVPTKIGPADGFDDDVCLYIKIRPPARYPKRTIVDVLDEPWVLPWVKRHPNIKILAPSITGQDYLMNALGRKDIILIPENHCNYERIVKPKRDIINVGVIGTGTSFQIPYDEASKEFEKLGVNFIHQGRYDTRQDVIDFYMDLDIQVVFRHWLNFPQMNNPLKLANACSFGVPTIAYPEPCYKAEFDGYFIPVTTQEELFQQVKRLKEDKVLYDELREKGFEKAEEYHIEKISKLYLQLDEDYKSVDERTYISYTDTLLELDKSKDSNGGKDIRFRIAAILLDKEVMLSDRTVKVYGLSHFRVHPRGENIGTICVKYFEEAARRDDKYAVVAFCDDGVLPFYLKCGLVDNGTW